MIRKLIEVIEEGWAGECGIFMERWHTTTWKPGILETVDGRSVVIQMGQSNVEIITTRYTSFAERDKLLRNYMRELNNGRTSQHRNKAG